MAAEKGDRSETRSRASGVTRLLAGYAAAALVAGAVLASSAGVLSGLYARAKAVQGPPPREPLPVEARRVEMESAYRVIDRYAGRIETAREAELAFERQGLVLEVLVEEGARVEAAAAIARLDARDLQAERDRLAADKTRIESDLALAERTRARQENLSNKGFASEQRFDEAQARETALKAQIASIDAQIRRLEIDISKSTLTAPFAGLIAERALDPGAVAQPGRAVVHLLELGAPRARIGLPPARAAELTIGERYALEVRGERIEGRLIALRPDLAPSTRTVAALFDLSGVVTLAGAPAAAPGSASVASGEIVRLAQERVVAAEGFWVPLSALQENVKGLWSVYTLAPDPELRDEDGEAIWRVGQEAVAPIQVRGQQAFVAGTLRDGAPIVVSGVNRIARGQAVRPLFNAAPNSRVEMSRSQSGALSDGY